MESHCAFETLEIKINPNITNDFANIFFMLLYGFKIVLFETVKLIMISSQ